MRHKRIPGKKRKGPKDLEARKEEREKALAPKINAKPANPDDQEIPRKLREMMKAKEKLMSQGGKMPRSQRKAKAEVYRGKKLLDSSLSAGTETRLPGMKRPLKPIPVFKQMAGEPKKAFYRRMDRTVNAVLQRKNYEDKYNVEVTDDPETGQTSVKDREKDEIELELEKKKKAKKGSKGIIVKSKEEKRQIRRAKEKEKRLKKKRRKGGDDTAQSQRDIDGDDDVDDDPAKEFTDMQDEVKFNEVAHAPPTKLATFKNNLTERRPGQKANLLLAQKLQKNVGNKETLSLARKQVLENERQKVIEEYRKLRAEKYDLANKQRA